MQMVVDARSSLESDIVRLHRRRMFVSLAMLSPAVMFLLVAFVAPIGSVLYNSVRGGGAATILPSTTEALGRWNGSTGLDDSFYRGLGSELQKAARDDQVADLSRVLNYRISGFRSLLTRTAREVRDIAPTDLTRARFSAIDARWIDPVHLSAIRAVGRPLTEYFILAALDLRRSADGGIELAPADRRIYVDYLSRTLWICVVVTFVCLAMGYPLAYLIATTSGRTTRILLILVMLSFWTSILVRTAAWVIILRQDGLMNGLLRQLGVTDAPIQLLYNRFAVCLVMVHVLMPFMILPIYSVMKGLPSNLMKAASSLGAPPVRAFAQVYLPLTLPGVSAGVLFTYILALGFYIAPALVGGANDQMVSSQIARFALGEAHWSMASSLAILLLLSATAFYLLVSRVAPLERALPIR